jgi:hypothetical protein
VIDALLFGQIALHKLQLPASHFFLFFSFSLVASANYSRACPEILLLNTCVSRFARGKASRRVSLSRERVKNRSHVSAQNTPNEMQFLLAF